MLSVIIPTKETGKSFPKLLGQLAADDIQLIVSDGLSEDGTLELAAQAGAILAIGAPGRGHQLRRGAEMARADWLLFLHADSVLTDNWRQLVDQHIEHFPDKAGFFSLKYDSPKLGARWVELMTAWRCMRIPFPKGWALPYGDQGLLISRRFYDEIGGYPDWPLFEDVNIAEKIGRLRLRPLGGKITTCHAKHEADGFVRRGWKNLKLLRRYKKGESIEILAKEYAQ